MTRKHIFPAGEYYIGDPCYLIPDKDWEKIGKDTNWWGSEYNSSSEPKDFDDGIYHWNKKTCFAAFTAHGDGCYGNRKGNTVIAVDSGLIGIIPLDEKENPKDPFDFYTYGLIRKFGKRFEVWEEDGIFHFGGKVKVNTK